MNTTNDITVIEPEHWALRDIAQKINDATQTAEGQARSAMQSAMTAGDLLTQAKGHVQHGQWNEWLLANCTVAPRTAQAYMRLFKQVPALEDSKAQRVADLPLREAIKAIATVPEVPTSTRGLAVQTVSKTERERNAAVFLRSAKGLKEATRFFAITGAMTGPQVLKLRTALTAAIDALDALQSPSASDDAKAMS